MRPTDVVILDIRGANRRFESPGLEIALANSHTYDGESTGYIEAKSAQDVEEILQHRVEDVVQLLRVRSTITSHIARSWYAYTPSSMHHAMIGLRSQVNDVFPLSLYIHKCAVEESHYAAKQLEVLMETTRTPTCTLQHIVSQIVPSYEPPSPNGWIPRFSWMLNRGTPENQRFAFEHFRKILTPYLAAAHLQREIGELYTFCPNTPILPTPLIQLKRLRCTEEQLQDPRYTKLLSSHWKARR